MRAAGRWNAPCSSILRRYGTSPDHGIWERRGAGKHYVFSKVMTWVAFDRGIKSAEKFGFKAPLEKWRSLRDTIYREVCEKGFDREQNAFVESYGSQCSTPASCCCRRWASCRRRIRGCADARGDRKIPDAGWLRAAARSARSLRRRQQPIEGAFLACSLWLADAYVLIGRDRQGAGAVRPRGRRRNDLGLLAEEYDQAKRPPDRQFPAGADPYRADQHRA